MESIVSKFKNGRLKKDTLVALLQKKEQEEYENIDLAIQLLSAGGLPIYEEDDYVYLQSAYNRYRDDTFVFVDIETNGGKPKHNDIIEIGAIKVKNGEIIDKLDTLVFAENVPSFITKITGIYEDELVDAPKASRVLLKFKEFLNDAIFVAHDVEFDYNFISYKLNSIGIGSLYNRKICTIKLAQKLVDTSKYNLFDLGTILGMEIKTVHRAYCDAFWAYKIFIKLLDMTPKQISTTEELIHFSINGVKNHKKVLLN
jgi:DNA polymerase-3 subunit epsilon